MPTHHIPYPETGYFSQLICDYLQQNEALNSFYNRFPVIDNFKDQIQEKSTFPTTHREVLVKELKDQYQILPDTTAVFDAIDLLSQSNTYTVTTGHQLNLFTGPLYFLYKIIDAITLSRKLKDAYPEANFVPVYWMATEDHDFEEINHFRLHGKKVNWNREDITDNDRGAVGRLSTLGLDAVYKQFCAEIGSTDLAQQLCKLFEDAYVSHKTLTEATRYLTHTLFGTYGLVIIDADCSNLKRLFANYMQDELLNNTAFETVSKQAASLAQKGYTTQVNAREINLFYLTDGLRERIIYKEGLYYINNTEIQFSKEELIEELNIHPECFSPNVIMRPLYQEVILPNLCYIGGGGELAYWLELKTYFDQVGVVFPMLMLRNSVMLMTQKEYSKTQKLGLQLRDLFLQQNDLVNRKIRQISNIDIDFSTQRKHLSEQFEAMYELAQKTDSSFIGAVKAQEVKQLKGLDALEKRLLKAQKRKLADHVNRLTNLQDKVFPERNLQERVLNFSEIYTAFGKDLISYLVDELDPLDYRFTVLVY